VTSERPANGPDQSIRGSENRTSPNGMERRRCPRGAHTEPERRHLVALVLGSYAEMPGLSLHLHQAARLFGLRDRTCEIVLDDLVRAGRLRQSKDGQYRGANGGGL
jgi:hypothetical protein